MAKFNVELPDEVIRQLQIVDGSLEKIMSSMTKAGADVVRQQVERTLPNPKLKDHLHVSVTYKTPSDGGINTKVYLSGYLPFQGNRKTFSFYGGKGTEYTSSRGVPVPLLCNLYEYGRSGKPFPKKPFMRAAFGKKALIEKAMREAQKKASGGILDDK